MTAVVRRDRWIVGIALGLACALAWAWLIRQAQGMSAPGAPLSGAMSATMAMAPTPAMVPAPGSAAYFGGAFVMWSLMMVAMMLPSAAPMILIYARFTAGTKSPGGSLAPTFFFTAVYLAVWAAFSFAAASAQTLLVKTGLLSAARLALGDERIAGALLVAAGLYQLTPLKRACLGQCRAPLALLMREWRPGGAGAVRLGLIHAVYCVGCCWALMALLFVGGVMSLAWVALLAVIVLVEKVAPIGERFTWVIGGVAGLAGIILALGVKPPF